MELRPLQKECVDLINANPTGRYIIAAHVGYGKRQPYSSLILTPNGYVKMGDLKIGDIIYDGYGEETTVTGIYEQGIQDVYKVTFSDGSVCECGLEHLWKVRTHRSKEWKVIELKEIMDKGMTSYEIPLAPMHKSPKRYFKSVEKFRREQSKCIMVSSPDHTYITNGLS